MPQNFNGFLDTCTMGHLQIDIQNSAAYNIPFPCSGGDVSNSTAFTTDTCLNNVLPWQLYAERYAIDHLKVNMDPFTHRVIIMPANYSSIMTSECGLGPIMDEPCDQQM